MTKRKLIGWGLIASPFIALFIYRTVEKGILETTLIFVVTAALVVTIYFGAKMID